MEERYMDINKTKIGFVGFGNMGQALAEGWIKSGTVSPSLLYASARNLTKLNENTQRLGIQAAASNEELVNIVDIVILAVKPHQIPAVCEPLKTQLQDKIVISIAVNYLFDNYEKILEKGTSHLSTLPNTPVSINKGVVLFEETHSLDENQHKFVKKLFAILSHVEDVPSEQMGVAGVITGSAPAFVDIFMEALADAGVKHGLDRNTAYRLISHMTSGAAELQAESGKHPGQLKDEITSPGGTTIKGVSALEKNNFRGSILEAVDSILEE